MQFATPNAFYALLLLPALVLFFAGTSRRKERAAKRLGESGLVSRLSLGVSRARERWKSALFLVGVFFLVLALARPQWGQGTEEMVAKGVDVFILLDTSYSMDATDIAPSRMARARYIASELIDKLRGNRIGLVVFSGAAFVQCPLTLDYGAAKIFLDTVATGVVPDPGTDIVQAIDAARRGFVARDSKFRVIVLLTDGEETGGNVAAIAEKAKEEDILIDTVGIGTPGGQPIPVRDDKGNVTDYMRDESGQTVMSRLDEETLSRLANATGGKYFRLSDRDEEIQEIADGIMKLEGADLQSQLFRRFQERYYWPLGVAVLFLAGEALVPRGRRRKEKEAV